MGFVNKFIPEEDVQKYQLAEIDKRFVVGGYQCPRLDHRPRARHLFAECGGRWPYRSGNTQPDQMDAVLARHIACVRAGRHGKRR